MLNQGCLDDDPTLCVQWGTKAFKRDQRLFYIVTWFCYIQ